MKNKRLLLLVISSLLVVTSCRATESSSSEPSSSQEPSSSESSQESSSESSQESSSESSRESSSAPAEKRMKDKTVNVYRLFNRDNEYLDPVLDEEQYQLGTVDFSFRKDQDEFIPYITLDNLAELYSKFYLNKANTYNEVDVDEGLCSWSVSVDDKVIFNSEINIVDKTFTYSGSLEKYVSTKKDYDKYSIMLRAKSETSTIDLPYSQQYIVDYSDVDFEVIEEEDKVYFPFSMLHTMYHELTGHDFFFNYTYLYEYNEVEDISKASITEGEKVYTPMEQMEEFIANHVKEKDVSNKPLMPEYLRKYHRAEFLFTMNHYYGLSETWGVESMTDYYKTYGLYDSFVDENSAVRGAAYSQAFFMLSDAHSGRIILGDDPWVESNGNTEVNPGARSTLTTERLLLSQALTEQRDRFLKENGFDSIKNALIYSKDGKTAYFGFDSFDASTKAYDSKGNVKSDDVLASSDSYFYFVKMLKAIEEHNASSETKVENIIIDDSLNGGGYVAVMGRLLALLSKDNNGTAHYINDITNVIAKSVYHVDTNNDGKYDTADVYGNKFKFYILTSPISFSCGNAFPFLAQNQFDHVKIIGAKSGGGECVVGTNYMSNGMGYAHSSNEHLIIMKDEAKKEFEGVEDGVNVNGTIRYNDFYNMDKMVEAIGKIIN